MRVGGWGKEREIRVVKHDVVKKINEILFINHTFTHLSSVCVCFVFVSLIIMINEVANVS